LCDRADEIREAGAELVVVGNGSPQQARWFAEEQRAPVTVVTDPDLAVFRAIGARRGPVSSLGPATFLRSLRAWRNGFRSSAVMGDPLQQGAVWVVLPGGRVAYRYASAWAGDHPEPAEILGALKSASGAARG
jgi:hypothetical protein